tara:strand:+ start:287 stop:652 length:366 start_codon:yes stop_codon:yes gene_type:complete
MGDTELTNLLEQTNLDDPIPGVFTDVGVWNSISNYMNPILAQAEKIARAQVLKEDETMRALEQDVEYGIFEDSDGYMRSREALSFRRYQRDLMLDQVQQLHQAMMFVRRLGGLPMYRQPRR